MTSTSNVLSPSHSLRASFALAVLVAVAAAHPAHADKKWWWTSKVQKQRAPTTMHEKGWRGWSGWGGWGDSWGGHYGSTKQSWWGLGGHLATGDVYVERVHLYAPNYNVPSVTSPEWWSGHGGWTKKKKGKWGWGHFGVSKLIGHRGGDGDEERPRGWSGQGGWKQGDGAFGNVLSVGSSKQGHVKHHPVVDVGASNNNKWRSKRINHRRVVHSPQSQTALNRHYIKPLTTIC